MKALREGCLMMNNLFFNIERNLICEGSDVYNIDQYIGEFFEKNGLLSAPKLEYNFPGFSCISVNDVVTHGVPRKYKLREGDLVSVDISFYYPNNHYFDSARTYLVGNRDIKKLMMIEFAKKMIEIAVEELNQRLRMNQRIFYEDFGKIFYSIIKNSDYAIVSEYGGHRIGKNKLHLEPTVPNLIDPSIPSIDEINEDDILCVEPIICPRIGRNDMVVKVYKDGWNVKSWNGASSSHHERMILKKYNRLICLT